MATVDIPTNYQTIKTRLENIIIKVLGENIKTINNQSLLGSGNISGGGLSFDDVYPVGAIYMSINGTNPSELFGGTWEQIEDTFLLASGDTYSNGATGGEATHTLTTNEMPLHQHKNYQWSIIVSNGGNTGKYKTPTVDSTNKSQWNIMREDSNQNRYVEITGGGQAHNNMPPYLTVYMWKRIA